MLGTFIFVLLIFGLSTIRYSFFDNVRTNEIDTSKKTVTTELIRSQSIISSLHVDGSKQEIFHYDFSEINSRGNFLKFPKSFSHKSDGSEGYVLTLLSSDDAAIKKTLTEKRSQFQDGIDGANTQASSGGLIPKNNEKNLIDEYYYLAITLSGAILVVLLSFTIFAVAKKDRTRVFNDLSHSPKEQDSSETNDFALGGILMECALTIDLDGKIKFVNQEAVNLLSYPQDSMIGEHFDKLFKPNGDGIDGIWLNSRMHQQVLTGQTFESESISFLDANGYEIQIALRVVPLTKNEKPFGAMLAFRDITNIKKTHYEIWRRANFDSLTNLPNRNLFFDRLSLELKKSLRGQLSLGLMFIDIDRFKEVNDTYGHQIGDRLLMELASRISECVRDSDTVARLGGDEFTVILTQQNDLMNIERVGQKILQIISEPVLIGDVKITTSCSIGIAIAPQDTTDIQELVNFADEAMYSAKKLGRNQLHFFTEPLRDAMRTRITVVNDLQDALSNGHFLIEYQPIVKTQSNQVAMHEALIRWNHPLRGIIYPHEFIKHAEDAGLITSLGNWVFSQAIIDLTTYAEKNNGKYPTTTINVSPLQFKTQADCAKNWVNVMKNVGISGESIVIEITESMILEDSEQIKANIEILRDYGVTFGLDDFGTGYSSLSYLKKFDIQYLKIDKSFIIGSKTSKSDQIIIEGIVGIAHKLNMQVVAEGVEDLNQLEYLKQINCDFVQGYFLGQPNSR